MCLSSLNQNLNLVWIWIKNVFKVTLMAVFFALFLNCEEILGSLNFVTSCKIRIKTTEGYEKMNSLKNGI